MVTKNSFINFVKDVISLFSASASKKKKVCWPLSYLLVGRDLGERQ